MSNAVWLTIVGIGEEGWQGLSVAAQQAVARAEILIGGARHLALVPEDVNPLAQREEWLSPFSRAIEALLNHRSQRPNQPLCVLASGDPMFYGVAASLSRLLPIGSMQIFSHPSSLSLAAARMGWPLQDCVTLSVHGRPLALVQPHLHPYARLLVLSEDGTTPKRLADLLRARGFGSSRLTVLEHLGHPERERRLEGMAEDWSLEQTADLNIVAIDCGQQIAPWTETGQKPSGYGRLSCLAGLPDEAFLHDGQLTKRDVRAVTLARLAPSPGMLLWDVGAGCGSISIEWMRAHPSCRAIAIEAHEGRQEMIRHNSQALGVPGLTLVAGQAPLALEGLPPPDAVFIGGGVTVEGVVERCWQALRPGGRLVANAVTLQSESTLLRWRQERGGDLTRLEVSQCGTLGRFDVWRQAMPIVLWTVEKSS